MKRGLVLKTAFCNLRQHRLRSLLALLGIGMGSAAIVALLSSTSLATQEAMQQFKQLGTHFLVVNLGQKKAEIHRAAPSLSFSLTETQRLKERNSAIQRITPYFFVNEALYYKAQAVEGFVMAVRAPLQSMLGIRLSEGRFISDLDRYSSYCVIGAEIAEQLRQKGLSNPLGQPLKIGSLLFTVIGVLQPMGSSLFLMADLNQAVLLPMARAYLFNRAASMDALLVQLRANADYRSVQAELKSELMRAHPNALIDIRNPQQLFAVMLKQRHTFNALLISIAVMALLMGGVGIMNILWVAVNERRSEIGLRLALGARKRDIAQLFLMEALLLSVVGGMLGVLSGQLGVFLLARGLHWSFSANVIACGAGFAVALIVGIVAGSYPAYRAAQAQPMEILFN